MIRISTLLLTATLGLIMSALTAQAANTQLATTQAAKTSTIPISFLPFPPITAPGTYVVTADLIYSGTGTAISILGNLTAPVVLDLKGHTLTGSSKPSAQNFSVGISVFGNGPSVSSISIQNGAITSFGIGVWAQPSNGGGTGQSANNLSSIDVTRIG
jgi:hypothetical protein